LPSSLAGSAIQHSFICDLTGIIGLLPALLTWRKTWERWKEITLIARATDLGVFVLGLGAALLLVFDNAHEKELQLFYLMLPPMTPAYALHGDPDAVRPAASEGSAMVLEGRFRQRAQVNLVQQSRRSACAL
jgi:hypothetical protein